MDTLEQYLPQVLLEIYEPMAILHQSAVRQTLLLSQRETGELMVLKRSTEIDLLQEEAKFLEELAGDGIPDRVSFSEDGVYGYLLRAYIPGETLLDFGQKRGSLSTEETVQIGRALCGIVKRLHNRKPPVVHRDIKAENVIRRTDGSLYLIDFGIARHYERGARQDTRIMGTPSVAPPEQFGYCQTDPRSDIYSIGCLLHLLATGETDINCGKVAAPLQKLIQKCVHFDPAKRYSSVAALDKALGNLSSRHRRVWAWLALGLGLALGALFLSSGLSQVNSVADDRIESGASSEETAPLDTQQIDAVQPQQTSDSTASAAASGLSADGLYYFASSEIEKEVCRQLDREPGPVPEQELAKIDTLMLCGVWYFMDATEFSTHGKDVTLPYFGVIDSGVRGPISTLEDIPHLPNLKKLMLCREQISDLSPLAGCGIEWLVLHGNWISDLDPLKHCKNLHELWIGDNPVTDLSPLTELPELWHLHIDADPVTDLSPLADMPRLRSVDLCDCPLEADISPLLSAQSLYGLAIRPLNADRVGVIGKLTGLTQLRLWLADDMTDLRAISTLTELEYMFVDLRLADSCEGIETLINLRSLGIVSDDPVDLRPLTELKHLEELDITELNVLSLEPLPALPALRKLTCSQEQFEPLQLLFSGSPVELISS